MEPIVAELLRRMLQLVTSGCRLRVVCCLLVSRVRVVSVTYRSNIIGVSAHGERRVLLTGYYLRQGG